MKQAGWFHNGYSGQFKGNYNGDAVKEAGIIAEAWRRAVIDEALAHYTLINNRQGIKREDLCNG
jgi:hypothetical protein